MADTATIERLEIEVSVNDKGAQKSLEALKNTLSKFQIKSPKGLNTIAKNLGLLGEHASNLSGKVYTLKQVSDALKTYSSINAPAFSKSHITNIGLLGEAIDKLPKNSYSAVSNLANAMTSLSGIPSLQGFNSVAKNVSSLAQALPQLNSADVSGLQEKMQTLAAAMSPLGAVSGAKDFSLMTNGLKSLVNVIPQINALDASALEKFKSQVEELTKAMAPLAVEMEKISNGFAKLPSRIQQAITATGRINKEMTNAQKSGKNAFVLIRDLGDELDKLGGFLKQVWDAAGGWFNQSNAYTESINFLNIAMGDAADSAKEYQEKVTDAMGIDPSEWLQNLSSFNQMLSGFGIKNDVSSQMSQQLTQVAYDLASVWNTDVETAFTKLKSGIAGQTEGLYAWGVNLTVASLKETALALGITKSVSAMSEAEKAQLRYISIMQKTANVQGDLSRTIASPANALRILSGLWAQLKTALGNVVSVIASKVIPIFQAVVIAITDAASALASLLGFEMPKIDYSGMSSGLGSVGDAADSATGSIGGTSAAAKKLKKQLMGFDELNILNNPSSGGGSGGGGGSSGIGGSGLGIDLSKWNYDFIGNASIKAKKLAEKLKKVAKVIKDMFPTVKGILGALAAFKLTELVKQTVDWVKALFNAKDAAQKTTIAISALTGGAITIGSAIGNIVKGTGNLWANLGQVAIALTSMGVAANAAWGPVGLVVTAVVALGSAIVGAVTAEKEMNVALMESALYEGGVGEKITDMANRYSEVIAQLGIADTAFSENQAKIKELDTAIYEASTSIYSIEAAIQSGTISAQEGTQQITEAFSTMASSTKEKLAIMADDIKRALATRLAEAVVAAGGSVDEYMGVIDRVMGNTTSRIDELEDEIASLGKQYEAGKISEQLYYAEIGTRQAEIERLSGSTNDLGTQIGNIYKNIDFESADSLSQSIDQVTSSAQEAKGGINEYYDGITTMLKNYRDIATSDEDKAKISNMILASDESRAQDLAEVDAKVKEFTDQVQGGIVTHTEEAYNKALEEWNNMPRWKQALFYNNNPAEFVKSSITNYQNNVAKPIMGDIQTSFNTLGIDGETWAYTAIDHILTTAFTANPYKGIICAFGEDIGSSVNGAFETVGKQAPAGYANGILENITTSDNAAEEMTGSSLEAGANGIEVNSPSKAFARIGEYAVLGYAEGIKDNKNTVVDAINDLTKDLLTAAGDIFSEQRWKAMAVTASKALAKNFTMPTLKSIGLKVNYSAAYGAKKNVADALGLSGWPNLKWYAYKNGGFPEDGMFFANSGELVGKFSNGKTAVANNEQIIDGIAVGVYNAMVAAQKNGGASSGNIHVTVELDKKAVGESVVGYNNDIVRQTGSSPLLT